MIDVNTANDTLDFFKRFCPNPVEKNFTTQLGCHVEEFGEMLEELTPENLDVGNAIRDAYVAVTHLATVLKKQGGVIIHEDRKPMFLDALCDQIVTAIGVGHMGRHQILEALNAVNISNFSKFDENGDPIFDENMKMIKGPNYKQADVTPFV